MTTLQSNRLAYEAPVVNNIFDPDLRAQVDELLAERKRKPRLTQIEAYESRRGLALRKQWRWRAVAANGRVVAVSSEGYNNRADMDRGLEIAREAMLRSHI